MNHRFSTRRVVTLGLLTLMTLGFSTPNRALAQKFYDREEIPGLYTIGFYADPVASSREIVLGKDDDSFECFIGISGDSTRVFSAVVMRLELPDFVEMDGPIKWARLDQLKEKGSILGMGAEVQFSETCAEQKTSVPFMIGRMTFKVDPRLREATITPLPHRQHGLSLELCYPSEDWPKPIAEPRALTVRRQISFWDRVSGWFN